jgi:hypothetical protein
MDHLFGPVVGGAAFALAIVTALIVGGRAEGWRATKAAWSKAARELGFDYSPGWLFTSGTISGQFEGLSLEIAVESGEDSSTHFSIDGWGEWSPNLTIGPNRGWLALGSEGKHILLNDPAFDEEIKLLGDEEEVVALMDAETRQAIRTFIAHGGRMSWGQLTLRRNAVLKESGEIVEQARSLMHLALRLNRRAPVRQSLLANVQTDGVPAVRARNLQLLVDKFGNSEEAKRAVEAAFGDRDPYVRLLGASSERGERGMASFQAIAADLRAPVDVRVMAIERLVSLFKYESAKTLVARALAAPERPLNRVAVVACGAAGDASQLDRICALATIGDAALTEDVATALGKLGDKRAEATLVGLLGHETTAVRIAAAAALGLVGSVDAVEPLFLLGKGLLGNPKLREVSRDAICRIQSRLGDAEAGRVSLASVDEAAGAVSLSAGGGEISLSPGEERSTPTDSPPQGPALERVK